MSTLTQRVTCLEKGHELAYNVEEHSSYEDYWSNLNVHCLRCQAKGESRSLGWIARWAFRKLKGIAERTELK